MAHVLTHNPAHVWREYPRETIALGLLGFVASAAFASASYTVPSVTGPVADKIEAVAPPAPPPLLV
ncbi:MAG: hypothetical protein ACJ8EY_09130, partial [Sphingomicrobium sp.]